MTPEEAKRMVGTEFTYTFDEEIGLTCMTLDTKTRDGWVPEEPVKEDGTWCVVGYDFPSRGGLAEALECLDIIRDTGIWFPSRVKGMKACGYGTSCAF